jgi:hypothetical protein
MSDFMQRQITGKYTLYWSPEGRPIARGVEAQNARAAIRKAPKPYRKYLGEIWAECENPNAYVAVIRILSDGFLLGGTRNHSSSPFASETDARNFALQSVEVNKARPGFENADIRSEIIGVWVKNPIPEAR